jgi:AraC family transcriptional regulator of adaptative response/methylated-DNA-[protein]-cysteine methyltransferase
MNSSIEYSGDLVGGFYTCGDSAIGRLMLIHAGGAIRALLAGDDDAALLSEARRRFGRNLQEDESGKGASMLARIRAGIASGAAECELPLAPIGTPFQQRVWKELQALPAGTTASYSEIARRIGHPRAARAVARACGANPIAVLIPCHRIVRGDGSLGGYRWGLERKRELLRREQGNAQSADNQDSGVRIMLPVDRRPGDRRPTGAFRVCGEESDQGSRTARP